MIYSDVCLAIELSAGLKDFFKMYFNISWLIKNTFQQRQKRWIIQDFILHSELVSAHV